MDMQPGKLRVNHAKRWNSQSAVLCAADWLFAVQVWLLSGRDVSANGNRSCPVSGIDDVFFVVGPPFLILRRVTRSVICRQRPFIVITSFQLAVPSGSV